MNDDTEAKRREMVAEMPAELLARTQAGEPVWDTDQMRAEFEVTGFMAPLVVVRRRSDGKVGSLQFTHNPRFYFGWQEDR
jgi:hypothetical protein